MIHFATSHTPIGRLLFVAREGASALSGLYLEDHARGPTIGARGDWLESPSRFDAARRQLDEYFAGKRTTFDLALDPEGTLFQRRVWIALASIPFGRTTTYGDLARVLGAPGSARAVGHANARNPLSIVVPCHRVIGASGSLVGYAGGEERKRWLLDFERARGAGGQAIVDGQAWGGIRSHRQGPSPGRGRSSWSTTRTRSAPSS